MERKEAIWSWLGLVLVQTQQQRQELCNHHRTWPRWLQLLLTIASFYKKAAAVFLGVILKPLVFCQSFPTWVGEGFPCIVSLALFTSVPSWQAWFPFCSAMEEPRAVPWEGVQCDQMSKQPLTCQELDHLHAGELALSFKTLCENYIVCKKPDTCSFTSESQVPPQYTRAQ